MRYYLLLLLFHTVEEIYPSCPPVCNSGLSGDVRDIALRDKRLNF